MTAPDALPACYIDISMGTQQLRLLDGGRELLRVPVSTGSNGPGEQFGSECTPRGWHVIRACIGAGCPVNSVFVGRRPTGEIYSPVLRAQHPGRDWILTRILWLCGLEPGRNRGGNVDTQRRYVYIHGTPDDVALGQPGSHGCVRIHNEALLTLFELVSAGTRVLLREDA